VQLDDPFRRAGFAGRVGFVMRQHGGRLGCGWLGGAALLAALTSCKAPDGSDLFQQRLPSLTSETGGSSGAGDEADAGDVLISVAAPSSEGHGGAGGVGNDGGIVSDPLNVEPDAALPDAGAAVPVADAAPAPPACIPVTEVCDGLDNDCDGLVDEGSACEDDCAGFALAGRGYMFCSESVDRAEAVSLCELEGLRLAWVETSEENAFLIASIVAADVPAPDDEEILTHIGGSDSGSEGNWSWRGTAEIADGFQFWQGTFADDGGKPVGGAFANWSPTEPNDTDGNEDCAVISVLGNNNRLPGNWDDRDCDTELPFVCEVP
jgi:hypothetical protein